MKNALLALALFAFVGTAAAHGDKDAKKGKKATAKTECSAAQKTAMGGAGCCMKKATSTTAATPAPAPAVAVKAL